jgi:hypothetical protein
MNRDLAICTLACMLASDVVLSIWLTDMLVTIFRAGVIPQYMLVVISSLVVPCIYVRSCILHVVSTYPIWIYVYLLELTHLATLLVLFYMKLYGPVIVLLLMNMGVCSCCCAVMCRRVIPPDEFEYIDQETQEDCVICRDNIATDGVIHIVCRQTYHRTCLNRWIQEAGTCPTCREIINEC